jgi:hypothetical protein
MAFTKIEGPIGGERTDYYASMISMYAGGPYEKKPSSDAFAMPWAESDEDESDADEDWEM